MYLTDSIVFSEKLVFAGNDGFLPFVWITSKGLDVMKLYYYRSIVCRTPPPAKSIVPYSNYRMYVAFE